MNIRLARIVLAAGLLGAASVSRAQTNGLAAVAETRQALRKEGFKTDLGDFDFSTPSAQRDREDQLRAASLRRGSRRFVNHPNLMETAGTNAAVVVWQAATLRKSFRTGLDENDEMSWAEFRDSLSSNQPPLDAACAAVLSGPLRFNLVAARGSELLLAHLSTMRSLAQMFGSRAVLALHDGRLDTAWTNLMAATRLATAWQIEPVEISQYVRFNIVAMAFAALWQGLQTNGWSDGQLAPLQAEWESADFFSNLPETVAFTRACDVADCEKERQEVLATRPAFSEFFNDGAAPPTSAAEADDRWKRIDYAEHGSFDDEKALLLYYRNRELEMRRAIQAATWAEMRRLPGVTNFPAFQSPFSSLVKMRIDQREMNQGLQSQGAGLLGGAARAETERRLAVTALALERYHRRHGQYPEKLTELTPDFLKAPVRDFMDGRSLRYHRADGGHFILYSVGLDGVDDGGCIAQTPPPAPAEFARGHFGAAPKGDLIWPLPASAALVENVRAEERETRERQAEQTEEGLAELQWNHSARHQADADKLLAAPAATNLADPVLGGHHLSELFRNATNGDAKPPSWREMLTLHQVRTGQEPETVTFDLPLNYDVVARAGALRLMIDTNNDDSESGCLALQVECKRAPNGNCRLVWSTIFESPGKHALQANLLLNDLPSNSDGFAGPLLPFTITNLGQFSLASATFDPGVGASMRAKLPEKNGRYSIDLNTTNGTLLKNITGSTSNGVIAVRWDLIDSKGVRFAGEEFDSVFHITLPDSGRSQTLKGP